jgi:GNAT superfamily N-acetyltransferase
VATRLLPWAHGTVVRTDDVPSYYEYNLARIEGGDPGLDAAGLVAAAEPALADLGHRRIEAEDTAAGARLAPGFAALGWVVERLAFLHRELPAPAPGGMHGAELAIEGFAASRELRAAWQGESIWGEGEGFAAIEERVAARRGTRAAVARLDGAPAGFAGFSAHGDTAEIETVFCLPERRNGGLGGALVAAALDTAHVEGARHALIEADDDGDSKRLYERLGFRTVWVRHSFTRVAERG